MKNSKHTPGPWRVGDAGHAIFGPPGSGMYPNAPITIVQKLANKGNARLIAAAPEMLEALGAVIQDNRLMNAIAPEKRRLIMDAIAKARGES